MEDAETLEQAEMFLRDKDELNLPDFIRYASIIISPLLLETNFKEAVKKFLSEGDTAQATETTTKA
jgi:hypothetical protein